MNGSANSLPNHLPKLGFATCQLKLGLRTSNLLIGSMDCLLYHSSFKVYKVNPLIALPCPCFRTVTCESSKGQLYCRPHFLEVVHGICKYYIFLLYDYVHSVSLFCSMDNFEEMGSTIQLAF